MIKMKRDLRHQNKGMKGKTARSQERLINEELEIILFFNFLVLDFLLFFCAVSQWKNESQCHHFFLNFSSKKAFLYCCIICIQFAVIFGQEWSQFRREVNRLEWNLLRLKSSTQNFPSSHNSLTQVVYSITKIPHNFHFQFA